MVIGVLAVGCTGDGAPPLAEAVSAPIGPRYDEPSGSPGQPIASSAEPAAALPPASLRWPILAAMPICYGACAGSWPEDLPEVAVYADGTVFTASVADASPESLSITRFELAASEQVALIEAAGTAGLHAGGLRINGATQWSLGGGSHVAVADGSAALFFTRVGAAATILEAPLLDMTDADRGGNDVRQRTALRDLLRRLRALATHPDAKRVANPGYVVLADAGSAPGEDRSPVPWDGQSIAEYDDKIGNRACGLIEEGGASESQRRRLAGGALDGRGIYTGSGQTWTVHVRPLLPHERSCSDVAAWREMIGNRKRLNVRDGPAPATA